MISAPPAAMAFFQGRQRSSSTLLPARSRAFLFKTCSAAAQPPQHAALPLQVEDLKHNYDALLYGASGARDAHFGKLQGVTFTLPAATDLFFKTKTCLMEDSSKCLSSGRALAACLILLDPA